MHAQHLRVVMLTGDNWRTAQAIARQVGLDPEQEVKAEVLPGDKADAAIFGGAVLRSVHASLPPRSSRPPVRSAAVASTPSTSRAATVEEASVIGLV